MTPDLLLPSSRGRSVPAVLAVLIVVLLAADLAAVVARRSHDTDAGQPPAPTPTTSTGAAAAPPAADAPPAPSPAPTSLLPHVPPGQGRELEELMTQVAEVRGLPWKEPLQLRV